MQPCDIFLGYRERANYQEIQEKPPTIAKHSLTHCCYGSVLQIPQSNVSHHQITEVSKDFGGRCSSPFRSELHHSWLQISSLSYHCWNEDPIALNFKLEASFRKSASPKNSTKNPSHLTPLSSILLLPIAYVFDNVYSSASSTHPHLYMQPLYWFLQHPQAFNTRKDQVARGSSPYQNLSMPPHRVGLHEALQFHFLGS